MSTPVLITALAVTFCALASYIVHKTGTTTGIVDVGRALGALIAELVTGFNRLP